MSITEKVAVLLALCLTFLLINYLSRSSWLKVLTVIGMLGFLGAASYVALTAVF